MQSYQSSDLITAKVLFAWRQTVAAEVDDLVAWLRTPHDDRRGHRPDREPPGNLYTRTATLCSWGAVNLPNLNTEPVTRLYDVLVRWHQEPDPDTLPDGNAVQRLLEATMMVTAAIDAELRRRGDVPPSPPQKQVNLDTLGGEAKALALLVENPKWTDTKIAKHVPCSRTQLYRWPLFMAAREQQDEARLEMKKGSQKEGRIEAW